MSSREGEGGVGVSRESGVKWDHRPSSFKLRHLLLTQFDRQREREREREDKWALGRHLVAGCRFSERVGDEMKQNKLQGRQRG